MMLCLLSDEPSVAILQRQTPPASIVASVTYRHSGETVRAHYARLEAENDNNPDPADIVFYERVSQRQVL